MWLASSCTSTVWLAWDIAFARPKRSWTGAAGTRGQLVESRDGQQSRRQDRSECRAKKKQVHPRTALQAIRYPQSKKGVKNDANRKLLAPDPRLLVFRLYPCREPNKVKLYRMRSWQGSAGNSKGVVNVSGSSFPHLTNHVLVVACQVAHMVAGFHSCNMVHVIRRTCTATHLLLTWLRMPVPAIFSVSPGERSHQPLTQTLSAPVRDVNTSRIDVVPLISTKRISRASSRITRNKGFNSALRP